MMGEEQAHEASRATLTRGAPVLRVEDLVPRGASAPVSFSVFEREIVGVAGLLGSGRSRLLRTIYGTHRASSGTVSLRGAELKRGRGPRGAIRLGVGFVPEDRKREGLVLDMSLTRNATMSCLNAVSRWGVLSAQQERRMASRTVELLNVATASLETPIGRLSGGNQQKVVLGKALNASPSLLLLDEPSRGVDINAKGQIHNELARLAAQGLAILMVSSEVEELFMVCDRVLVLGPAGILADVRVAESNINDVLRLCMEGSTV